MGNKLKTWGLNINSKKLKRIDNYVVRGCHNVELIRLIKLLARKHGKIVKCFRLFPTLDRVVIEVILTAGDAS